MMHDTKARSEAHHSAENDQGPDLMRNQTRIKDNERFCFDCQPQMSCFNTCCRDVNVMLTPVDVLALARHLVMSTSDFLDQFTLRQNTKDFHLPVVVLRMENGSDKRCPFVTANGCNVYKHRPWVCRMYPLGVGLSSARLDYGPTPYFAILDDDFCQGQQQQPREWTIDSWRSDQGLVRRDALERGYRELVSHPWFAGGRQLTPAGIENFYMATYDMDRFRQFVLESSFLNRIWVERDHIERIRLDDDALMSFGVRWLRFTLFGEPTFARREGEQAHGRRS